MTEDSACVGAGILNLFQDASLYYRIVGTVMCILPKVAVFTELIYGILHCGR